MSLGEVAARFVTGIDQPSSAEQALLRKRRAVIRWADTERFWYVVYYSDGRRLFVIDWSDWQMALTGALAWVGLTR